MPWTKLNLWPLKAVVNGIKAFKHISCLVNTGMAQSIMSLNSFHRKRDAIFCITFSSFKKTQNNWFGNQFQRFSGKSYGERVRRTISRIEQEVDESGRFVDHKGLTWNFASRSTTVFLSWYPDLALSVPDILSLMEESERGTQRERERDGDSLINWKRSSTPPFRVQTHGVIRTTLLCCHLPPFSPLCSPPLGKPFNQPRGEYMVMIWKERRGRQQEKRDTRWGESISAVDTIVTQTALMVCGFFF